MFERRLEQLRVVLNECLCTHFADNVKIDTAIRNAIEMIHETDHNAGIVYVVGNGGSAGIASHFCTDLLRTLKVAAATLSDAGILTCFSNDFGYENVYHLPLKCNLRKNDLLIAISSSGKSPNILKAMELAHTVQAATITLSGFDEKNALRQMGDLNFWIDSSDYGLVETGHFFLLHSIVDLWSPCERKSKILATLSQ